MLRAAVVVDLLYQRTHKEQTASRTPKGAECLSEIIPFPPLIIFPFIPSLCTKRLKQNKKKSCYCKFPVLCEDIHVVKNIKYLDLIGGKNSSVQLCPPLHTASKVNLPVYSVFALGGHFSP